MQDEAQRPEVSRCSWRLCKHWWQWQWASPSPAQRPFVGPLFGPGAAPTLDVHRLLSSNSHAKQELLVPPFYRSLPQVGGVEPGFVQAGWSLVCAPTTGHVIPPQVQLAHLVQSSKLSSQRMTRREKSKILLNQWEPTDARYPERGSDAMFWPPGKRASLSGFRTY